MSELHTMYLLAVIFFMTIVFVFFSFFYYNTLFFQKKIVITMVIVFLAIAIATTTPFSEIIAAASIGFMSFIGIMVLAYLLTGFLALTGFCVGITTSARGYELLMIIIYILIIVAFSIISL
jgi:hypothetical protein